MYKIVMDQTLILKILFPIILSVVVLIWFAWKKTGWKYKTKWIVTAGIAVVFLFVIIYSIGSYGPALKEAAPPNLPVEEIKNIPVEERAKVTRVIDGDTIKLENGHLVRYIGIDAPETVDPEKPIQCFGHEASKKNKELLEGKEIKMAKDVSDTDQYGRLLRYVYVDDIFVNDYLVRNGYARADNFPPDEEFKDPFKAAQAEAKENKRGLWAACK